MEGDTPRAEQPGGLSAQAVLARVQELSDAGRPDTGYPLEWVVAAYFLGDASAIASSRLRAGGGAAEVG